MQIANVQTIIKKRTILKKKIVIPLVLILMIGGFFYWWNHPKSQIRQWWIEEIEMGGNVRDFSIKETSEGTIVENGKEGLRTRVPEGWKAQKAETVFFSTWGVHLFSPDLKIKAYAPPDLYLLEKGCVIDIFIEKSNLFYNVTSRRIEEVNNVDKEPPTLESDGFEIIKIGGYQAVKTLLYDASEKGKRIEIRIPLKDEKNIYFVFCSFSEDRARCTQIFDEFLNTALIK